jgi:chromosomal replication initiator protein
MGASGASRVEDRNVWTELRAALSERLSPQVCATWVRQMSCLHADRSSLRIGLPDAFSLNWVKDHYRDVLEEELARIADGAVLELEVGIADPSTTDGLEAAPIPEPAPAEDPPPAVIEAVDPQTPRAPIPRLNDRYTFGSFIVGPSNELAWTAARTVAESAGKGPSYNPLVVVGGVGLGKTHLLHAIGHIAARRRPSVKIQLKTSEDFINDVVSGIRGQQMERVRARYRDCDVLLIDDIQFISGKGSCQEEFFHTFNALHDARKQIVVTSDRLPHEIPDLEERVRSRFAWGLIADLKLPELETRVAIVRSKARADGIEIDDAVTTYLAQSVRSNMRELEGCLNRVHAMAALRRSPVTMSLVKEVLRGIISDRGQALTCDVIVKAVAAHFDVKVADLKSNRRSKNIAFPRQVAMYLCRQHTGSSYPEIGHALGGKDHTTALNANRRIAERIGDPEVRAHVEAIERGLLD